MLDEKIVAGLPESSGVYLFRDGEDGIIYIGKAKNIKDRVRNYLGIHGKDAKTLRLMNAIERVDIILTRNEKEAFLLENNLIKEHTPKYNINLKDDKTYISLKLTVNSRFPALYVTRKIEDDGALYFGPYPHAKDVKEVLEVVRSFYPLRRCKDTVFRKRKRACILYDLNKCPAPCTVPVDEESYRESVEELVDFLSGREQRLFEEIEQRIEEASSKWDFEKANHLKEKYIALKGMVERQQVHEHLGKNRDVWAFAEEEGAFRAIVLTFRKGVLISKRSFTEGVIAGTYEDTISSFLYQYYSTRPIPDDILLSEPTGDMPLIEKYLKQRRGRPVRIHGPRSRLSRQVLPLAIENLNEPVTVPLGELFRRSLKLKAEPARIEIYDISHIHGKNPTGAMVVFEMFKPKKDAYRVFHIREADPMDDVSMIGEVLERRLRDEKIRPLPDLIIIDGGKGHLAGAARVVSASGVDTGIIGIAKGERRKRLEDLVYMPLRKNPLSFSRTSPVFKQIVRMRDEAHRFAIASHKRWKRKEDLS